ncbi:MAG: response regulator [Pseudomonadota bacterium]
MESIVYLPLAVYFSTAKRVAERIFWKGHLHVIDLSVGQEGPLIARKLPRTLVSSPLNISSRPLVSRENFFPFYKRQPDFYDSRLVFGRGTRPWNFVGKSPSVFFAPAAHNSSGSSNSSRKSLDQDWNPASLCALVVDDNGDVLETIGSILSSLGMTVHLANSSREARACAQTASKIDLLMSDVVLSRDSSGPKLAQELRQLHPQMVVLFMSGYSWQVLLEKGFLDGSANLITKPFRLEDLTLKLRNLFAADQIR